MITPKLRFSEFKDEWLDYSINDFAETVTSGSRDWAKYYSKSGDKFIRMTNLIRNGIYLNLDDLKFVNLPIDSNEGKRTSLQHGDILVSITAELGKIGWIPNDLGTAYINQHTALIRTNDKIDSKFLAYLLSTEKYNNQINGLNDSGAKAGLNLSTLRNFKFIASQNKKEQTKIAEFLSAVDDKISQLSRQLELLNQYKKGVMQKIFSQEIRFKNDNGEDFGEWDEKELNEIFDFSRGEPLSKNDLDEQGQYDCIHYGELFTKYNEVANRIYSKTNKKANKIGKKGYILMPSSDVTPDGLARATCLNKDEVYLGGDINVLKPKTEINSIFFSYLINSDKSRLLTCVAGTTVKHIYNKDICGLIYNFPSSIQEQEKIAGFLTAIDERIDHTTAQLTHTKQWKKGLLQQMFI